MCQYDYLMALILLTGPPESPVTASSELLQSLRPALHDLAVQMEILDPREVRYLLARDEDLYADLTLLRRRNQELADAPFLVDAERFPDRHAINGFLTLNRGYRQHIVNRQLVELANWWELQNIIQETDVLYHTWDALRDARCEYYFVTVRRSALQKARAGMGFHAYYETILPPPLPLWRLPTIE